MGSAVLGPWAHASSQPGLLRTLFVCFCLFCVPPRVLQNNYFLYLKILNLHMEWPLIGPSGEGAGPTALASGGSNTMKCLLQVVRSPVQDTVTK